MKAAVYTKYGGPEVLKIKEIEKPFPKDDEVLIKVFAASINDWDNGLLHGDFINRLLNGLLKPKRKILGSDIAGRLEAAGKNVTRFKTGDDVYGVEGESLLVSPVQSRLQRRRGQSAQSLWPSD